MSIVYCPTFSFNLSFLHKGQTISQNLPLETFEVSSPLILVLWSHLSMVLRFVLIGVNFVWEVCLSHPFKTERGQNICWMKSSPSIPLQLNFIIIFFALSTPKACHTLWQHELWLAKSCVSITVRKTWEGSRRYTPSYTPSWTVWRI